MPGTDTPVTTIAQVVADSHDPHALVILRSARGLRCSKTFLLGPNNQIMKHDYPGEKFWFPEVLLARDFATFVAGMEILVTTTDRILVRDGLLDSVTLFPVQRRSNGEGAAFQRQMRSTVVIDIDGMVLPEDAIHRAPAERVALAIQRLPACFHNVACFYHFTSSYLVFAPANELRVRLYFMLSQPVSAFAWKCFLQPYGLHTPVKVDLSFYDSVRPYYFAAPKFTHMRDPMPTGRSGVYDPTGATTLVDVSCVPHRDRDVAASIRLALTRVEHPPHPGEIEVLIDKAYSVDLQSSRHNYMLAFLGNLRGYNVPDEQAVQLAKDWMIDRGRMPGHNEVERGLVFINQRLAAGTLQISGTPVAQMFDMEGEQAVDEAHHITPEAMAENAAANDEAVSEWPSQPNQMARRAFVELFRSEGYVRWQETDYEWNGTYWREMSDDEELGARIQRASRQPPGTVERCVKALRNDQHKAQLSPPCTLIDGLPIAPRVCLANGWLSVAGVRSGQLTLSPYISEIFDTVAPMTVAYDPDAQCPRFLRFLDEIFNGSTESRTALLRLMGYLLFKGNEYQKAFILTGLPASGKSTWLRVMRELLGPKRSAIGDLRSLSGEFGLASCYEAQALFLPEASHSEGGAFVNGEAVDQLKRISGGDPVLIRRKYMADVQTTSMPTPVVICNAPPIVRDEAFIRRLVTIHFPQSFVGREDPTLTATLSGELPGILNAALRGLQEIGYEREPFPPPAERPGEQQSAARQTYEAIRIESSPVAEFVRQCLVQLPGSLLSYDNIHAAYCRWAAEHTTTRAPQRQVLARILSINLGLEHGRRQIEGERRRGLENVGWSEEGRRWTEGTTAF